MDRGQRHTGHIWDICHIRDIPGIARDTQETPSSMAHRTYMGLCHIRDIPGIAKDAVVNGINFLYEIVRTYIRLYHIRDIPGIARDAVVNGINFLYEIVIHQLVQLLQRRLI
jgi:hypothetical protein